MNISSVPETIQELFKNILCVFSKQFICSIINYSMSGDILDIGDSLEQKAEPPLFNGPNILLEK